MAANETHTIPEEVPLSEADVRKMDLQDAVLYSRGRAPVGLQRAENVGKVRSFEAGKVTRVAISHKLSAPILDLSTRICFSITSMFQNPINSGLSFGAEFILIYQHHPNVNMAAICQGDTTTVRSWSR
jgi:hypothetical protein